MILVSVLKQNDNGTPRLTAPYEAGLSAGFDKSAAHASLELSENVEPVAILAIGKQADIDSATDPKFAEGEKLPSSRLALSEIVLAAL